MSCGLISPGTGPLVPTSRALVLGVRSGMSVHKQCNVPASAAHTHARCVCVRVRAHVYLWCDPCGGLFIV